MSVSGLKAELKFLASIFDKNHERFRIVSWKLDELHCQFLVPPPAPPGSPHSPPPPLTLHCNITVRRPAGEESGAPSARTKGRLPRRGPSDPWAARAGSAPFPGEGPGWGPAGAARGWGGSRRTARFSGFPGGAGFGAAGPSRPRSPHLEVVDRARPSPRRIAMPSTARGLPPGAAARGSAVV